MPNSCVRLGPLLAVAASALLASCSDDESTAAAPQASAARKALAAQSAAVDATGLFNWAETAFPTLFPAGPQNQQIVYEGKTYTIRYYASTQNYLGVTGEDIFGLGPFTGDALMGFGKLSDWQCEILGQTCLSGLAAGAAALANATVDAKCAGGAASATTGSDGRYTLAIAASLPCVLRVTAADGSVLHSVAAGSGSGSRSTVQITPMSDLVTAYLAGASPAAFYAGFTSADAAKLGTSAVSGAVTSVVSTVKIAGVDFSMVGDVLSATLTPGSGGNAHGQAIAQLAGKLGGGLTQAALADALSRTTPAAKAAGTPSLPADMLLLPAAANCAALRSGSYRLVTSDVNEPTGLVSFDATTLRFTAPDSSWAIEPNGKCRFKEAGGSEYVVSDAGVIVSRLEMENSIFRAAVMFPEQQHALADIAGSWNGLSLEDQSQDGKGWIHASTVTVAADGKVTALTYCGKDAGKVASDCISAASAAEGLPNLSYSVNPEGGFTLTNTTDGWADRTFFYRSGSGQLMNATGGHLSLSTQQRPAALPSIGQVSEYWNLGISTTYTALSAVSEGKYTISGVDSASGVYSRDSVFNSTTGATRPERLEVNRFRQGFTHRIPESVTASDGSAQTVGEFVALRLHGTGLAAAGILGSTQSLVLSLNKSTAP